MLISLEGLDNCGKTTQADMISKRLSEKGYNVIISKELTTEIGRLLKNSFKGVQYSPVMKSLLFSADRQERLELLSEYIKVESNVVIFDRYIHSALAYRLSEGIDEQWILSVNKNAPPIDLGLYIDITSHESIRRNNTNKENIIYSQLQLDLIRERYLEYVKRGELLLINGKGDVNDITELLIKLITSKIKGENYEF